MNAFQAQMIQNGLVADSGAVDNALATATAAADASGAARHYLAGIIASYSAAVALIKAITITYTPEGGSAVSLVINWDFSKGPALIALPGIVHGKYGNAVTATLAASGTGGTTGRIYLFYSVM